MLKYEAEMGNDTLTAVIRDSSTGGVEMSVRVESPIIGDSLVHIGFYTNETEAQEELKTMFPDMKWR